MPPKSKKKPVGEASNPRTSSSASHALHLSTSSLPIVQSDVSTSGKGVTVCDVKPFMGPQLNLNPNYLSSFTLPTGQQIEYDDDDDDEDDDELPEAQKKEMEHLTSIVDAAFRRADLQKSAGLLG